MMRWVHDYNSIYLGEGEVPRRFYCLGSICHHQICSNTGLRRETFGESTSAEIVFRTQDKSFLFLLQNF